MNKLEVGMYVKTKNNGIKKIKGFHSNLYKDFISVDKGFDLVDKKEIIKASNNIIDLIEVGDVLIDKEGHKYPINYNFETDYNNEYQSYEITIDDHITLFFKDGLSIVTKEQFEAMTYKVGGNNE